jgi:hypothetical protein
VSESTASTSARRGAQRHAATEEAFREAWRRLKAGTPTHPELMGRDWQVTISTICLEAGHTRNALYDGHPGLLQEIRDAISGQQHATVRTRTEAKRGKLQAELAACRADMQRLISENAALLLRAVTAEETLARLQLRTPRPFKMTHDTPEAS